MSLQIARCLRRSTPLITRAYTLSLPKLGPRTFRRMAYLGATALVVASVGYCGYCNMNFSARAKATSQASPQSSYDARFVLYQYSNCPFCSKVRAYLHSSGEEFNIVEVNPITKEQTKALGTTYRKVPLLMADGVELTESSVIMSVLHSHFTTGQPINEVVQLYNKVVVHDDYMLPHKDSYFAMFYNLQQKWNSYWKTKEIMEYPNRYQIMGSDPKKAKEQQNEAEWRDWIDDHFVHLISPNVYRTPKEALAAFDYFTASGNFTDFQKTYTKYIGATVMYLIGKRLKKRHKLYNDPRIDLYSGAAKWVGGLKGQPFMGGDSPNLADISMFGMCSAFEGMECWNDLIGEVKILPWYTRVKEVLQEKSKHEIAVVNPQPLSQSQPSTMVM